MSIVPNPLPEEHKKWINLLLTLIATFGFGFGSGIVHSINPFEYNNRQSTTKKLQPVFSLTDYNQLEPGDTLRDVQRTLGIGVEESRSNSQSVYVWINPDSSYIKATFSKGILQSKKQSGLQSSICIA